MVSAFAASLECLAVNVQRAREPKACVARLAGVRSEPVGQLAHRLRRDVRGHHQHGRNLGDLRERHEVLHRLVRQLRKERRQLHEARGRGHQERVAVGFRLRHSLGADDRVRARLVLHHHRLVPALAGFLADFARDQVSRTPRGEGE